MDTIISKSYLLSLLLCFYALPLWAGGICLDAGHGGKDSGAVWRKTKEAAIVLQIVRRLAKKLGSEVVLTRKNDTYISLKRRCEIANSSGANLFISIHINSSSVPPKKGGAEVWYYQGSKAGKRLASIIARKIGAKRGVKAGRFYVLKHTRMPAVLIECGFINVKEDREKLLSPAYQEWLAEKIAEAIKEVK